MPKKSTRLTPDAMPMDFTTVVGERRKEPERQHHETDAEPENRVFLLELAPAQQFDHEAERRERGQPGDDGQFHAGPFLRPEFRFGSTAVSIPRRSRTRKSGPRAAQGTRSWRQIVWIAGMGQLVHRDGVCPGGAGYRCIRHRR